MESKNCKITVAQAKSTDIVTYLLGIGHEPVKIRNNDYWYLSPLRNERTASFKVNRKLNRWYDHGIGKGGNLVDFGILYFNCSVKEFLQKLNDSSSLQLHAVSTCTPKKKEQKITILGNFIITSYELIKYLLERKISLNIAGQFCREIRFTLNEKTYYAIGFQNDAGGYELRNSFLKLSSSPKAVTAIQNGSDSLCVFEGFFDFLSYLSLYESSVLQYDYLVLNSTAFFENNLAFMEQYTCVKLFLDRDTTGQNCSRVALKRSSIYNDESYLYKSYTDLNNWLVNRPDDTS